jgi:hypothetical protein
LKQRMSVDFPHPEGPIRATILFLGTSIEIDFTASLSP